MKETKWNKLDNTANLFPVITNEKLSNVYRISTTIIEDVKPELLQKALENILPWFEVFNVRMRSGFFWYYFETNKKKPKIEEEMTYPCRYIDPYANNNFLFRVSYYKNRINLEVFHALTDGLGAFTFLKELTYEYLKLAYEEVRKNAPEGLSKDCSLNCEDSYLKNYKKTKEPPKGYKKVKAVNIKGELLNPPVMGIIHGYIDLESIKRVCKEKNISINQYLVAVLTYSIYKEYLNSSTSEKPICINAPVNLRPFYNSNTTKNFYAVVTSVFKAEKEEYSFEEILDIVVDSLKKQTTKKHMDELIYYNVSNEKKWYLRLFPLFLKNFGIKMVYNGASKAYTTTLTNLGVIKVLPEYEKYIKQFHVLLSVGKEQTVKCCVSTYGDKLLFTFCSALADNYLERCFFRKLSEDGIDVEIESNGVYNEKM